MVQEEILVLYILMMSQLQKINNYSKNLGLIIKSIAGSKVKDAIKAVNIESIIRNPKNLTGINAENNNTENPTTTDIALKKIPLPVVVNVIIMASL